MPARSDSAAYWAPIYNAFDPFQPVPADRLDDWYVQRPDTPLGAILTRLAPEKLPDRLVLVGHPSSGKSTELTRVAAELAGDRYGYFVVRIDLSRNLNVDRANQIEVLFLIGAAAYKLAQEAGLRPDEARFQDLVEALQTLVRTHTENQEFKLDVGQILRGLVCFGAGLLGGAPGAVAAAGAMEVLGDFNFTSGTDQSIVKKTEVEPKINEILGHVNRILEDVGKHRDRAPVLLVDGLDRVRDEEVTQMLFVRNRFLADVGCRVLYTAPVYVYYRPEFAPVRQAFQTIPFPNVRLRHRDTKASDGQGYQAMRRVVTQRLRAPGIDRADAIETGALDALIAASGGLMRDLIRLVRDAAVRAEIDGKRRIDLSVARSAVAALRREYEAQITPRHQAVLKEVGKTKRRTEDPECDLLLKGNFILSYSNQDIWFDVHSVLSR